MTDNVTRNCHHLQTVEVNRFLGALGLAAYLVFQFEKWLRMRGREEEPVSRGARVAQKRAVGKAGARPARESP